MKKGSQGQRVEEIDDHDQPTEPMPRLVLSPDVATVPANAQPVEQVTVPASPGHNQSAQEPPYPHVPHPTFFPVFHRPDAPKADRYPYHPHEDLAGSGMVAAPPIGPIYPAPVQPRQAVQPKMKARRGNSSWPICIGLCFVAIQFLLLARFVFVLINLVTNTGGENTIYALSSVFMQPFQMLLPQFTAMTSLNAEIDTLLAILVYGFISRVLVHGLKMLTRV